jgi:hypothetical protein
MVADDLTRQINVQLEAGSTFPASLDLRITPVVQYLPMEGQQILLEQ